MARDIEISLSKLDEAFVRIDLMGEEMWLGIDALPWLFDAVRQLQDPPGGKSLKATFGVDDLSIATSGPVWDTTVDISNRRDESATHGGIKRLRLTILEARELLFAFIDFCGAREISLPEPNPAVVEPPPEATILPSGTTSLILVPGTGTQSPSAGSYVKYLCTSMPAYGERKRFQSGLMSVKAEPLDATYNDKEALELMKPGEIRRLWVKEESPNPTHFFAPKGFLARDLELIEFSDTPDF
jgi:hypothetical protein